MLGWDDHAIMTAPLARLNLAVKGRRDFVTGILQSVFGKPKDAQEAEELANTKPDPTKAMQQLTAWATRGQQRKRHKKK